MMVVEKVEEEVNSSGDGGITGVVVLEKQEVEEGDMAQQWL